MHEKSELICPKCLNKNTISLTKKHNCVHCQAELADEIYIKKSKIRIPFIYTLILGIILGAIGSIYLYTKMEQKRYPSGEEYFIIKECTSLQQQSWSKYPTEKKEQICINALTKTLKDVKSYDEDVYQQNSTMFMKLMKQNAIEKI